MNYKALMVDMDYCADPIWVSDDPTGNGGFANGSLSEFEDILPKGLLHALTVYQRTWEIAMWSKYISPSDDDTSFPADVLVYDMLHEMVPELAANLKEVLPECRVFYRRPNETMGRLDIVEVCAPTQLGIWQTMVG